LCARRATTQLRRSGLSKCAGCAQIRLLARKGLLFEIGLRRRGCNGAGTEFERLASTPPTTSSGGSTEGQCAARKPIAAEYETERSQYIMSLNRYRRLMRRRRDLAKLDYAINTALLLLLCRHAQGRPRGLLTFATMCDVSGTKRGKGQFYRMLEALLNVQFEPVRGRLTARPAYLGLKHKRRSLVVVLPSGHADAAKR